MTSFGLWAIISLINISFFLGVFGVLTLVTVIIAFLAVMMDPPYDKDDVIKISTWLKRGLVFSIVTFFIVAVVPSKKELAVIYVLPKVVNNEKVQKIPYKAIEKILSYLEIDECECK